MPELKSPFAGEMTPADASTLASYLGALTDPTRLQAISLLHSRTTMNGVQLIAALKSTQPTVSYHMHVLTAAGLVGQTKQGSSVWYRLDYAALAELVGLLTVRRPR